MLAEKLQEQVLPTIPRFHISQNEVGNRAIRRKRKPVDSSVVSLVQELNMTSHQLDRGVNMWRFQVQEGDTLGKTIFREKVPYMPLLDTVRTLSLRLDKWYQEHLRTGFPSLDVLEQYSAYDFYSHKGKPETKLWGLVKSGSVSLRDIENLSDDPDAFETNIKTINRFFRVTSPDALKITVVKTAMVLVAQPMALSSDKEIPPNLRLLHDNLKEYFEYWSDRFFDFDASLRQDFGTARTFALTCPWLAQSIGYFAMAQRGITSSSMMKLIDTRIALSNSTKFGWKMVGIDYMRRAVMDSYRTKGLPEDLLAVQYLNLQDDATASLALAGFYNRTKLTETQQEAAWERMESLVDKCMDQYFKVLYQDIIRSSNKRIEFQMPENYPITSVTMTHQNRQALIFILNFADNSTRLVLELDRERRYYGFPAEFFTKYDEFVPLVLNDIVSLVLNNARSKHPEVEGREKLVINGVSQGISPKIEKSEYVRQLKDNTGRKSKKPVITPIKQTLASPISPAESKKKIRVIYSRGRIIDSSAGHPSTEDVDRHVETIKRVERREIALKIITWSGGKRYVARSGDDRLVFNLIRNRFLFEKVADREEVYEDYGDYKVK